MSTATLEKVRAPTNGPRHIVCEGNEAAALDRGYNEAQVHRLGSKAAA